MKVTFSLHNPSREVSTIRAYIRFDGVRYCVPTGAQIACEKFVNQRCRACKEAASVNNRLAAVGAAMTNAALYFKQNFKTPTQEDYRKKVALFLAGNNAIEIKRRDQLLCEFAAEYISECGLAEETVKGYKTTYNKLKEYESVIGKELCFEDITLLFEAKFRAWLVRQNYSRNYIGTIFKNIKRFMGVATDVAKLHNNKDFQKFKVDAEVSDAFYLSIDELMKIHHLHITAEMVEAGRSDHRRQNTEATVKALTTAKNKFLIGAFCAMRISDFNRITEANIDGKFIRLMPHKGSSLRKPKPVVLPMHPVVREILQSGFDYQTPMLEQNLNRNIKEVCRLAGINQKVVYYRTEGGELRQYEVEKWEVVTSHTARRSGATNMYLAGMPIELIMACGGWRKRDMCEKYIKAGLDEVLDKIEKSSYFAEWEGEIGVKDVDAAWVRQRMQANEWGIGSLAMRLGVAEEELQRALDNGFDNPWQKAAFYWACR